MSRKFDREMLAALTKLGFEINEGGGSAYAECSVIAGPPLGGPDDIDLHVQMVTDNGAAVSFRRVTREQILLAARAIKNEDEAA